MWSILRLEALMCARSRATRAAVVLILFAGLVAVSHGVSVISRQQRALVESPHREADERARILAPLSPSANVGDQLYYLFFHTVRHPSPWAPLAVGQRDVHAFNLKIRLHGLLGQLYDVDLGNPLLAALGQFDLAFVLVVLVPLAVIALTFDLRSGEVEAGTWGIVCAQPISRGLLVLRRAAYPAAVNGLGVGIVLILAALWLDLPFDRTWWFVLAAVLAYVGFWMLLAVALAGLRRTSDNNLLILLGVWVGLTLLGPATISAAASLRFPMPEPLEVAILQRQGFHGAWDEPLPEVMEAFYRHYPEWRTVPVPQDTYSNAWYYAMHQRGDDAAREVATRYRERLEARDRWVATVSWSCPPAALHRLLTRTARTDLRATLDYLDSVAAYHESLKRHFWPAIFSNQPVSEVDWSAVPRHTHRD